ncbi:MAG: hypothetical protein J6X60_08570 [Ruminiclostridium sp.]|nr:hypothetical protein [Ruminiclostridium sp.]
MNLLKKALALNVKRIFGRLVSVLSVAALVCVVLSSCKGSNNFMSENDSDPADTMIEINDDTSEPEIEIPENEPEETTFDDFDISDYVTEDDPEFHEGALSTIPEITYAVQGDEDVTISLYDITDSPDEMWEEITWEILEEFKGYAPNGWFNDDYAEVIANKKRDLILEREGILVRFDDYELSEFRRGWECERPYYKILKYLNKSGMDALKMTDRDLIFAYYLEARVFSGWFIGDSCADESDMIEFNGMEYARFAYRDITTMESLKELFKTRWSDEVTDDFLSGDRFIESDGKLYIQDAARGSDISVHSVDYDTDYKEGDKEGVLFAHIIREGYDSKSGKMYLTGETDDVAFPFIMSENGAIFTSFPYVN